MKPADQIKTIAAAVAKEYTAEELFELFNEAILECPQGHSLSYDTTPLAVCSMNYREMIKTNNVEQMLRATMSISEFRNADYMMFIPIELEEHCRNVWTQIKLASSATERVYLRKIQNRLR